LEKVIEELEKVQLNLLADKKRQVPYERELFEKLQNADRENKERIKIMDSNLKNAENRVKDQINMRASLSRELEESQEIQHEQTQVITLLEERIKRLETENKNLTDDNKMKDDNLNILKDDLLELEKDRGTLSAVLFENKTLQDNCKLLDEKLRTYVKYEGENFILLKELKSLKDKVQYNGELLTTLEAEKHTLQENISSMTKELIDAKDKAVCFEEMCYTNNMAIVELKKEAEALAKESLEISHKKEKLEMTYSELNDKYFKNTEALSQLKNDLAIMDQKETLSSEMIESLNLDLLKYKEELSIKTNEIEEKKEIHKLELDHKDMQLNRVETSVKAKEATIQALQAEKQTHQKQLKQMQKALKTSLHHIRGLRTIIEESHSMSSPKFDEQSLTNLLQWSAPTERPQLSTLKLCLADLKRDVRELNLQLCDRSRGETPTNFNDRSMNSLDVPSFLERFQDSSVSTGNSTGTPSLSTSPLPSLTGSPDHTVRKLR